MPMGASYLRDEFLDELYAAAACGQDWKPALAAYTRMTDGHGAVFNIYDMKTGAACTGEWWNYADEFIRRGQAWVGQEPWLDAGKSKVAENPGLIRTGFVFHGAAEVPTVRLIETAWYRDYAREQGSRDCLTNTAFHKGRHALFIASHKCGRLARPFSEEQVLAVENTLPEFRRALSLHLHLAENATRDSMTALWSNVKIPVILLKGQQVLFANKKGIEALAAGEIVRMSGKRVILSAAALEEAVRNLERSETRQLSLQATGRTGSRWHAQAVRFNRLAGTILDKVGADDPAILLVLTPLDFDASGRAEALEALHGLTRVERQIATDLVSGMSVSTIVTARNLSVHTVRWHIKNLIEKMGAQSLSDLQRILALLLPL